LIKLSWRDPGKEKFDNPAVQYKAAVRTAIYEWSSTLYTGIFRE